MQKNPQLNDFSLRIVLKAVSTFSISLIHYAIIESRSVPNDDVYSPREPRLRPTFASERLVRFPWPAAW